MIAPLSNDPPTSSYDSPAPTNIPQADVQQVSLPSTSTVSACSDDDAAPAEPVDHLAEQNTLYEKLAKVCDGFDNNRKNNTNTLPQYNPHFKARGTASRYGRGRNNLNVGRGQGTVNNPPSSLPGNNNPLVLNADGFETVNSKKKQSCRGKPRSGQRNFHRGWGNGPGFYHGANGQAYYVV